MCVSREFKEGGGGALFLNNFLECLCRYPGIQVKEFFVLSVVLITVSSGFNRVESPNNDMKSNLPVSIV